MPRRQTGYQVLKSSTEHYKLKWLGLLLLYKSLINKPTDKDSAYFFFKIVTSGIERLHF